MVYAEIHPTLRAFIGNWEGLRKLGFQAEDLYCVIQRSVQLGGALGCFVQLLTQGKEFLVDVGPVDMDPMYFEQAYRAVVRAIQAGEIEQDDLDRIWQESAAYRRKTAFVFAIAAKGIMIPNSNSNANGSSSNGHS